MLVRGKGRVLEVTLAGAFPDALREVHDHLASRRDFYAGSRAIVDAAELEAGAAELRILRETFEVAGLTLEGVYGDVALGGAAAEAGITYLGVPPVTEIAPQRSRRPVALSENARSLVADFAGARADLAARRITRRITRAAPNGIASPGSVTLPGEASSPVAVGVSTLYHRGTLRGGQALHNLGNIVVVGDVNPGAELVASGDIVVFGALRGVAHAGAQGDRSASVLALDLAPTQLRIATVIAADGGGKRGTPRPERAQIHGDRIAVAPHDAVEFAPRESSR